MAAAVITTVGDLVEDVLVTATDGFRPATDTTARITRRRGGSAANVAVTIARHGGGARFVGSVGDDDLGDRLLADLVGEGVEPVVARQGRTGTLVVIVTPDGERSFFTDRGSSSALEGADARWLDGCEALHIPSYSFGDDPLATTSRKLLRLAADRRLPVTIDASSTALLDRLGPDRFRTLIAETRPRAVFANRDEAALLGIGAGTPLPGADVTVVRDGAVETHVVAADGRTTTVPVPAAPHPVTNTTGAGDAFAAGWIIALAAGADPVAATEHGHRVAREALTEMSSPAEEDR